MVCTKLVDELVIFKKGKLSNMNMPSVNKTTKSLKLLLKDIGELIDDIHVDIRNINNPKWNNSDENIKNLNENGWSPKLIECCKDINKRNKIKSRLELWRRFPAAMNPTHLNASAENDSNPVSPETLTQKTNPNGPKVVTTKLEEQNENGGR